MTLKIRVKVKFKVTKMKPIYDFLLMINNNHAPNLHRFQVINILNMTNGQMTLKIKVKVKFKVTKIKPMYDFLLMINSNHAPILHRFQVNNI